MRKGLTGDLSDRTEVLYVSPLKALGNDIQKNLEIPLGEILALAGERGLLMPEVSHRGADWRHAAAGATGHAEAASAILVTSPESLCSLLAAEKSRAILRDVETVIVDEIHAVAGDERGAHLALSLERLEALTHTPPVRVGLSATQKPIGRWPVFSRAIGAKSWKSGPQRLKPQIDRNVLAGTLESCPPISASHRQHRHTRTIDLAVEVPPMPLGPVASNELWDAIYDRLVVLVDSLGQRWCVDTRRMAERLATSWASAWARRTWRRSWSLSRKLRLAAEKKLKEGQVRVWFDGLARDWEDVGTVDLVVQINSPRAIAVALQRVGRSGHWRGAVPKGRFFCTTRDDLIECAALARAIRLGDLDRLMIPGSPLDVLAQQIVAACAAGTDVARAPRPRASRRRRRLEPGNFGVKS